MPSKNHSLVQTALLMGLAAYRGEYSFPSELSLDLEGLPRGTTPDLCIYPKLDIDYMHDEVRMTESPLVAVEIASPTQATQDIVDKIQQMIDAGVQSCWLVQPAMQAITVYTESAAPKTFSEGTLEDPATGIEVNVDEVFSEAQRVEKRFSRTPRAFIEAFDITEEARMAEGGFRLKVAG